MPPPRDLSADQRRPAVGAVVAVAAVAVAVVYAVAASYTHPFTTGADTVTAIPLAIAAIAVAARLQVRRRPVGPRPQAPDRIDPLVPSVGRGGRGGAVLGALLLCERSAIGTSDLEYVDRSSRLHPDRQDHCVCPVAGPGLVSGLAMSTRDWTLAVWGLVGLGVVICLLVTTVSKGRIPTLGATMRRITSSRVGRVVLVIGWMWLGWHAFAR